VAGVVNLIFKQNIEGFAGDVQYGESDRNDGVQTKYSLSYGTRFADGRGHFSIAGEYARTGGIYNKGRDWALAGYQPVANPNYRPGNGEYQKLILPNVHATNVTPGGVIVGGPLRGIQFGPGGVPEPFIFGAYAGSSYMSGGSGVMPGQYSLVATPLKRYNTFARTSFELTPQIEVFAEASFAHSVTEYPLNTSYALGNLSIRRDNAYLDSSIRQQMTALGLNSFNLGRLNWDLGFTDDYVGNTTYRGVVGAKGKFGDGWDWNAYYQQGENRYSQKLYNNLRTARLTQASDAVVNPATGQIVCRSSLAAPTNGCVPFNVFGFGSPSDAAHDYVMGTQWMLQHMKEKSAAFDISGEPFSIWAGPVSLAAGAEYRKESIDGVVDDLSLANTFLFGNPKPIDGSYDVREAFVETVVPLASGLPFVKSLDLNAAGRVTRYSTSGQVETWKVGLSYAVNDVWRLRFTRSRDIRAPNLGELFSSYVLTSASVIDPLSGLQVLIKSPTSGNSDLVPELADTLTGGIVYQSEVLPGLRASLDVYSIKLRGAISTLGSQDLVNRCYAGNTSLCGFIQRDATGTIDTVTRAFVNLSRRETSGVDAEVSYATPLSRFSNLDGDLTLRFLATYIDTLISDDGITRVDRAGDVGADVSGVPHWRWNASGTYTLGPAQLFLEGRYIGGGAYDSSQGDFYISPNKVDSQFLLNASVQYTIVNDGERSLQAFGSIRNILDQDPPRDPSSFIFVQGTNREIYEQTGRYMSVGLRFTY
jgi:outer membrane receptor protein involved in Fe transport